MDLAQSVAAKKTAPKVRRSETMSSLHSRLLGDVERALKDRGLTKVALQKAGGPSQQVLNKWDHGASPTVRTLESLAEALDSELIVAIPGVSDPPATVEEYLGGSGMTDHDLELARLIDGMDEGERRELLGYLRGRAASRPLAPGAGQRPDRDRSNASSGPTT